jgi:putative N6-adenine-specific DNA methylase
MAPLKETIAAAIVKMSRFSYNGIFCDPFCGSGTIPIEAAMIAKNIAPGLNRHFAFESFKQMDKKYLKDAKEEALSDTSFGTCFAFRRSCCSEIYGVCRR